ncbi:MAG: hypothetical protein ABL986_23075 [Vicinamibacterales bacterium]
MFRAALVSVVVLLAAGQELTLLCKAWCHDHAAVVICHPDNAQAGPSVAGRQTCANLAFVAVTRESGLRVDSSPDAAHATLVPRYQAALLTIGARIGREPWRSPLLGDPARPTVLRI